MHANARLGAGSTAVALNVFFTLSGCAPSQPSTPAASEPSSSAAAEQRASQLEQLKDQIALAAIDVEMAQQKIVVAKSEVEALRLELAVYEAAMRPYPDLGFKRRGKSYEQLQALSDELLELEAKWEEADKRRREWFSSRMQEIRAAVEAAHDQQIRTEEAEVGLLELELQSAIAKKEQLERRAEALSQAAR